MKLRAAGIMALSLVFFLTVTYNATSAGETEISRSQPKAVTIHGGATLGPTASCQTETREEVELYSQVSAAESTIKSTDWGDDDADILLKIAMAEAEGEDTEGKALVMLVVLNRVWSDIFPDTIKDVVFQNNQFSPVSAGGRYYTTEPDENCYEALELIEKGWDESQGALYFEAEKNAYNWHSKNLTYLFQHGSHRFYK